MELITSPGHAPEDWDAPGVPAQSTVLEPDAQRVFIYLVECVGWLITSIPTPLKHTQAIQRHRVWESEEELDDRDRGVDQLVVH